MKAKIIEIEDIGFLKSLIYRENAPSIEDAGIIAVKISEMVKPEMSSHEQAYFIAGFQECIKWLLYTDR
jgi:hypothetical protein